MKVPIFLLTENRGDPIFLPKDIVDYGILQSNLLRIFRTITRENKFPVAICSRKIARHIIFG